MMGMWFNEMTFVSEVAADLDVDGDAVGPPCEKPVGAMDAEDEASGVDPRSPSADPPF